MGLLQAEGKVALVRENHDWEQGLGCSGSQELWVAARPAAINTCYKKMLILRFLCKRQLSALFKCFHAFSRCLNLKYILNFMLRCFSELVLKPEGKKILNRASNGRKYCLNEINTSIYLATSN